MPELRKTSYSIKIKVKMMSIVSLSLVLLFLIKLRCGASVNTIYKNVYMNVKATPRTSQILSFFLNSYYLRNTKNTFEAYDQNHQSDKTCFNHNIPFF